MDCCGGGCCDRCCCCGRRGGRDTSWGKGVSLIYIHTDLENLPTDTHDSSSDDQNSSTTSTSDDNSPTSTVNTAFGTPTSFPSSLTGSDSACSGAICGATLSLATPVGSSNSADNLLLFALGTDGSFLYREADATGWKGNWSSLGGDFESPPAVVASSSGRLDIFGVTRSDLIMQYKTFRAGSWDSRWTSLGGDCYAPPALCGFPDGTIYVVTSSDARQTGIKKFSEGTWDRPGTANWNTHNTGYMASNPATACTRGKQAHVLAFGADERGAGPPYELMIKRDNGTRMDFWRTAGGSFQGEPVTFVEDADADVFTVFGLGADDAELYHGTFSRENATTVDGGGSPKRVGGPEFMSVPSVVRNPKGDIDILAVDRNGKLRRAAFDREATLSVDDWQDLGGFFSSAPAARLTANDTVSVFGMGPEGSIIHGRWTVDDDGKWTEGEWFDDGGDFSSRWYSPGPA